MPRGPALGTGMGLCREPPCGAGGTACREAEVERDWGANPTDLGDLPGMAPASCCSPMTPLSPGVSQRPGNDEEWFGPPIFESTTQKLRLGFGSERC